MRKSGIPGKTMSWSFFYSVTDFPFEIRVCVNYPGKHKSQSTSVTHNLM